MDENTPKPVVPTVNRTVRTFSSDMAGASGNKDISIAKIALAEQKKSEKKAVIEEAKGTPLKRILWVSGGVIFIILGIVITYFVIQTRIEEATPVIPTSVELRALIPYDQRANIDMTNITSGTEISALIKNEIGNSVKVGGIKDIFINKVLTGTTIQISSKEFVTSMGSSMPASLVRSLEDPYMVGTYMPRGSDKASLFLIFQTKDYNIAYASMLSWEGTLLDDMFAMFSIDVSGDKKELLDEPWKDIIINNKDARVLRDKDGMPALYYLFIDKSYFIITDSLDTIKEVSSRMITKNIKPL
jgi:hypothetical protein